MKEITVEFFPVYESWGRNYTLVARFTNLVDAMALSNKNGYYYSVGDKETKSFTIFESFKEYEDREADSVRRTALAKLTNAERLALGLN
jgi:hypothetical protein